MSYSQLVWLFLIAITLRFENVIPGLISADQYAQFEGIVLMVYLRGVTSWIIQCYTSYLELIGNH